MNPKKSNNIEVVNSAKKFEVAQIFKDFGGKYREDHRLNSYQIKIMNDIELCRTEHFGGHVEQCDTCRSERILYNSCRNRHCPKCQTVAKEKWLQARKSELLPVGYFHNVFTLPHDLNPIARYNPKLIYNLLFAAVSQTLLKLGLDPKHIGGKSGFISILHTWDQLLGLHIHLHVVIPGGALSLDGNNWLYPRKKKDFLFPIPVISPVFRGIFMQLFKESKANNEIVFAGKAEKFSTPKGFKTLLKQLRKSNWVVYSKKPFAGPEQVLDYLGRYTHKVAISNHRILNIDDKTVTFKYRDRKDENKEKICVVSGNEFIRRFLQHIVPHGFMRIRHYGFLANRCKKENIKKCRVLLGQSQVSSVKNMEETTVQLIKRLTGIDLTKCPHCKKGTMQIIRQIESFKERNQLLNKRKILKNTT